MHQPLNPWHQGHKGTEWQNADHGALENRILVQLLHKGFAAGLHFFLEDVTPRNHDVAALFLEALDEKRKGLAHVNLRILHIGQIHLADGAKRPAFDDLDLEPALDRGHHLAFHRNTLFPGIPEHIQPPDAGDGFGQSDFTFFGGNDVKVQFVTLLERQLSILIQQFGPFDHPVHFGARIYEHVSGTDGDDSSLNLITHLNIFIHAGAVGFKQFGKTLFFVR